MTIGAYSLFPVVAGRFRLDGGAMFGVVPKVLWSKFHPADDLNRVEMVSRSLLLAGKGNVILVNTGIGTSWNDKERSIYALDPSVTLQDSLAALGFAPKQVTHVILTHLHFDHAGGCTIDANGRSVSGGQYAGFGSGGDTDARNTRKPAFPNAVYFVQRRHLQWAEKPSARDRGSFLPHTWEGLVEQGLLEPIDGARELLPGVSLEIVHGHTPFQQLPRITDGTTTLLYCSDLVPFASQVKVPWVMGYDLRPVSTVREKHKLLSRAARENWLLFLEHDPHVERCRVEMTEKGLAAAPAAS
jgi:glyoxylase-like metal-dependent hydrolase (beta-lactamase superfamily II)